MRFAFDVGRLKRLTPEEDAIDDPDDVADEVDDTLPADLWFVRGRTGWPPATPLAAVDLLER